MLRTLDGVALLRWYSAALDLLIEHESELDSLNVFPVPDQDTGANLVATLTAAIGGEAPDGEGLPASARRCAAAAARSARGNSGLILAEVLGGIAEVATGPTLGGRDLAAALDRAARRAHGAVALPVQGTALSVLRDAADAAAAADAADAAGGRPGAGLTAVAERAAAAAASSVERTRDELPALRAAGVVDAGGRGVCLLLDALVAVTTGDPATPRPVGRPTARVRPGGPGDVAAERYEVQYLFTGDGGALRAALTPIGDSVVLSQLDGAQLAGAQLAGAEVDGVQLDGVQLDGIQPDAAQVDARGDQSWRVHVHTADAGAVIEAALRLGRPSDVAVAALPTPVQLTTVVCVGAGRAGWVLAAAGVTLASAADLPTVIAALGETSVVLLAAGDDAGLARVAAAGVRRAGRRAAVVPVRSEIQAIAAAAVCEPSAPFNDNLVAMAEAAAATRYAEVVLATAEAQTTAGRCRPGDVLGLAEGDVVVIAADAASCTRELLDRMLASGGELVTVLTGAGAGADELAEAMRTHLARTHPVVELTVYDAGPDAGSLLLLGVE